VTVLLSEVDHGTSVCVRISEEVVLELQENPTTGYRWTIETSGEALRQLAPTYAPAPNAEIGGGGKRTVRFIAVRAGTSEIRAVLRRSWEQQDGSLSTYAVKIKVEGEPDGNDE
jgi:inhibitor of cysteine peptidase